MRTITQTPSYRLKIEYDDTAINPRVDYDNFGHMACWHSRYNLGDKHEYSEPDEFLKDLIRDSTDADEVIKYVKSGQCPDVTLEYDRSNREWALKSRNNAFEKWFTEYTFSPKTINGSDMVKECILECLPMKDLKNIADKNNVILPLYLYDHSGITISCSNAYPYNDRWDAGQVGWIYASHKEIAEEYGKVDEETLKKAEDTLISETNTYDYYLRGDCYGYIIEKDGEEVDSCWGYLGDLREVIKSMQSDVTDEFHHLFDHVDYCQMDYEENTELDDEDAFEM